MSKFCKFCNQEAEFKPLKEMQLHFDIYFCKPCLAEYLYYPDEDEIWGYSLYTYINNQLYRWNVSGLGNAYIWHVKKPGIPGIAPNRKTKLLKTIKQDPLPAVTPANVNERLHTWITFL